MVRIASKTRDACVWMTYMNTVNGIDEDFVDMKSHGIEGIELNMWCVDVL